MKEKQQSVTKSRQIATDNKKKTDLNKKLIIKNWNIG